MVKTIDKYKKRIRLQGLQFEFDIYYNDNMLSSHIPNENVNWITKQLDYTSNTQNSKEYELLFLLINYSMKMFNFYLIKNIDKKLLSMQQIEWKKIKLDPYESIKKLEKYIRNSPKSENTIITYCGISYDKYLLMTKNLFYVSDIFISSTFDIYHAIKYSRSRSNDARKLGIHYILLKLIINSKVPMIYSIYENQVLFPQKTNFKVVETELKYLHYKDILSNEMSKKIYAVDIVSMLVS